MFPHPSTGLPDYNENYLQSPRSGEDKNLSQPVGDYTCAFRKLLVCSLKDLYLTTYLLSIFCLPFFFFKVLFSTICEFPACVVPYRDCQGLLRVQPF